MLKRKNLRQVRIHEQNSKTLEALRGQLPVKPSLEALTNVTITLGAATLAKLHKLALP